MMVPASRASLTVKVRIERSSVGPRDIIRFTSDSVRECRTSELASDGPRSFNAYG